MGMVAKMVHFFFILLEQDVSSVEFFKPKTELIEKQCSYETLWPFKGCTLKQSILLDTIEKRFKVEEKSSFTLLANYASTLTDSSVL